LSELEQMASTLAHEVNQPLTAISVYLQGARRFLAPSGQQNVLQALERTAEQADRARQTIQGLRDLARKREVHRPVETVTKTIEEASALVLVGFGQKLNLNIRVDAEAKEALIDKTQIQQVLLDLIRNAAETMEAMARREIAIVGARVGDMVEISVADTGPGLPVKCAPGCSSRS
jgi:two-component system, LuxR family, sensor kinase FixL